MARNADLTPDCGDVALLVDQECRALDPHIAFTVHTFFDPRAVGFAHIAFLIGGEGEVKLVFGFELIVLLNAAFGDTDNRCVQLFKGWFAVAEAAGFSGAARRIVLRVEIEYDFLAFELGERK